MYKRQIQYRKGVIVRPYLRKIYMVVGHSHHFRRPYLACDDKVGFLKNELLLEGNSEKNKIHLVNWESCLTSKKNGGAGIKNMKIQNQEFNDEVDMELQLR